MKYLVKTRNKPYSRNCITEMNHFNCLKPDARMISLPTQHWQRESMFAQFIGHAKSPERPHALFMCWTNKHKKPTHPSRTLASHLQHMPIICACAYTLPPISSSQRHQQANWGGRQAAAGASSSGNHHWVRACLHFTLDGGQAKHQRHGTERAHQIWCAVCYWLGYFLFAWRHTDTWASAGRTVGQTWWRVCVRECESAREESWAVGLCKHRSQLQWNVWSIAMHLPRWRRMVGDAAVQLSMVMWWCAIQFGGLLVLMCARTRGAEDGSQVCWLQWVQLKWMHWNADVSRIMFGFERASKYWDTY